MLALCPWTFCSPKLTVFLELHSQKVLRKLFSSRNKKCPQTNILTYFRAKWRQGWRSGWRSGTVVRALVSHQCGLGSNPGPGVICALSLLLVLYSAPRGFSAVTPVFPSPEKPTFPNFNSILECTYISERVLVNSLVLRD